MLLAYVRNMQPQSMSICWGICSFYLKNLAGFEPGSSVPEAAATSPASRRQDRFLPTFVLRKSTLRLKTRSTDVMILKIFSPKNFAKKLSFFAQNKAKLFKILIITLGFEKNANFFAENWQKSQKSVIITLTPGRPDEFLKKSPKMVPIPIFIRINTQSIPRENVAQKAWLLTYVIFNKLAKEKKNRQLWSP
jgi:hypothetical protein